MKCSLTIAVSLLFAFTLSCTAPEQTTERLVPAKTILPVPVSTPAETPLPTTTPVLPVDSSPRGGSVRLSDGGTASIVRVVPRDLIPAVFDPIHIPAADVEEQASEASLVIGVSIGGESVAYSVTYLSSREVVNDNVGGTPVLVTW